MAEVRAKTRDRLTKLFRLLGSANVGERENARAKIEEILHRHQKT